MKKILILFAILSCSFFSAYSQLSGSYTIGGSGASYQTINEAIDALQTNGTYRQVVFNINSGTYNETLIFPKIENATSLYNITFQSATGDSSDVIIKNVDSIFCVKFDTASHYIFRNLTFKTYNQTYDNTLIDYTNSSDIQFYNCNFVGSVNETNYKFTKYLMRSVEDSISLSNLIIDSSSFSKSTYGIYLFGKNDTTKTPYLEINHNTISEVTNGIKIQNYKWSSIKNNTIDGDYNSVYGIVAYITKCYYVDIHNNILRNDYVGINMSENTFCNAYNNTIYNIKGKGIQLWSFTDVDTGESEIYNNFISSIKASIWIHSSNYKKIYNNSLYSTGAYALEIETSTNIEAKNNILHGGFSTDTYNDNISDYNDFYTESNTIGNWTGTNCATLSDWQTVSGQDSHSLNYNPEYLSVVDFHTHSLHLNNKGTHIDLVDTDIDGEIRDVSTPDIGADEFTPYSYNLSILDIESNSDECDLTNTEDITITIFNRGTSTVSNINVSYTINNGAIVDEIVPITLNSLDTTVYTFTTKSDFSVPNNYTCTAYITLANDEEHSDDTLSIDIKSYGSISSYPFNENFAQNNTNYLKLYNNENALSYLTYSSLRFKCAIASSWEGGETPDSTQLWVLNYKYHAFAKSCNIDLTGLTNPALQFNLTYNASSSSNKMWFRVLINDTIELINTNGISEFTNNGQNNGNMIFSLENYIGQNITITFQSSIYDYLGAEIVVDDVAIGEKPIVDLGNDSSVCNGTSIVLDAGTGIGYTYAWFNTNNSDTLFTNQIFTVTSTGTYFVDVYSDAGIYSSDTVNITVNPTYFYQEQQAICDNDSLFWHNNYFKIEGTYYDSLQTTTGCDSVYELQLNVNPSYFFTEQQTICGNDTLIWHNNYYSMSGTYYDSLQTTTGCDSVYELQLFTNPSYIFYDTLSICNGDSVEWKGNFYTENGTYCDSFQTELSCDSIYQLQLIVNPTYFYVEHLEICENDSVIWHNNYYSTAGTYYDSLQTSTGCDSVYELQLNINPTYFTTENQEICENDYVQWHNNFYYYAGTYYDSLQTTTGCDSIFELQLTVNPLYYFEDTLAICNGDSVEWRNNYYTNAGIYYDSLQTVTGCDSVFALQLIVNQPFFFSEILNSCDDSVMWHNNYYYTSGTYYDSSLTVHGCDSVWEEIISFNPKYRIEEYDTICQGEILSWEGLTLVDAGTYEKPYTTIHGCDSIFKLHLFVGQKFYNEENATICANEKFEWHNNYYNIGGTYYDSLRTITGCDSIYKLNLTVNSLPTTTSIGGPDTVFVEDTVFYGIPTSYQINSWYINNGRIINQIDDFHINVKWDTIGTGTVYAIFENYDGCTDTTNLQVTIGSVGIDLVNNFTNISIYPNPAKNKLYINYNKAITVEIYNVLGEKIITTNKNIIDIAYLPQGTFVILIKNKNMNLLKVDKFVKQ